MRSSLCLATMLAASGLAAAETPLTIDQLLAQGQEIVGYASGYDNRTSLILFRHPGVNALVQCGVLFDVTRVPRTVVNCYELRQAGFADHAAKIIQNALGIESDDVVNYCLPKEWPDDREQRARYIGEWLKTEARYLAS